MPDINAGKCYACKKEKSKILGICENCNDLFLLGVKNTILGKKASKLWEANGKDIITPECYITKRDRLLHLQKIANDKYLTKLKTEVEKI